MIQNARNGSRRIAYETLPWVAVAGTLVALLAVVFAVSTLYSLGLGIDRNLTFDFVAQDSPAWRAGAHIGDRLLTVGGQPVYTRNRFRYLCRLYEANEWMIMGIERAGGTQRNLYVRPTADSQRARSALILFTVALAFLGIGTLVYFMSPGEVPARLLFGACVAMALSYGTAYASNPALGLLENAAFLVPSLTIHLFATFPVHRRWISTWWGKLLVYAPGVVLCGAATLTMVGLVKREMLYVLFYAPLYVAGGCAIGLGILMHTLFTSGDPVIRQQLKWIAWGVGVSVGLNLLALFFDRSRVAPGLFDIDLVNWSVLSVPVGLAFSILRYRLFDIDTVINRSIVYTIMGVAILMAYVLLGQFLATLDIGFALGSPAGVAILVVLLTVLFSPLYRSVQGVVDRVMYRRRPNYRQVLEDLSRQLAGSLDLDYLLSVLLDTLSRVTESDRIQIFVQEPQREHYGVAAVVGEVHSGKEIPYDGALPQCLAKNDQVLCMPNVADVGRADAREAAAKAYMVKEGLVLCVALRIRNTVLGWIGLGPKHDGWLYARDEQSFLVSLTDQAVVAIHNALLYRQAQNHARQQAILNRVGRILTSTLDLQTLLERFLEALVDIFSVEAASLLLLDKKSGELVFQVSEGTGREKLIGQRLSISSQSIASWVIRTGEQFVSNDVQAESQWYPRMDEITGISSRQLVAVPLEQRGEIIGVIEMLNRLDGTRFTEYDVEMLTMLAAQAAIVIENARLYTNTDQALADRVLELATMQQIDRELNMTLDFGAVMDRTLQWAMRMTLASAGFIGLILEDSDQERVQIAACRGYPFGLDHYQQHLYPIAQGIAGRAVLSAAPVRVKDVRESADYYRVRETTRSELAVPVLREESVIGVINLESDRLGAFDEEDEAFVVRLVDHAAIAIENARLYGQVKRANESKSEFVSLVSHELRAPMTVIKGYTELVQLTLGASLETKDQKLLDVIMVNVEQMQTLIDDLLHLARLESGELDIEPGPISIRTVLGNVMASLRRPIDAKELSVSWVVPSDLPPVHADPVRLNQILTNLISNAIKYTPGEGQIKVVVERCDEEGETGDQVFVCVSVRDSGIGIAPKDQQQLFHRFFRANHPAVREQTGTGLGLSITKTLVEMHGGEIGFESALDEGSTFWFTLPLSDIRERIEQTQP